MWVVFSFELLFSFDLGFLGIEPRTISGLIGIIASPLVHGSLSHIISNSLPLIFLGITLFVFYNRIALLIFANCYLLTGLLVWIFGRPFYHIGASGLIYAVAFFLISFGLFRKDFRSLLVSIVIVLIYGGMIYGVLPSQPHISWESHALGALVGIALAFVYKDTKKLD
jgi:membrane associated rhomboid family serine protease